jgi:plasmid stabilization system protein ParE
VKTRLAESTKVQARRRNKWWKKHRQKAPRLFAEELRDVRRQIAEKPNLGKLYAVRRGVAIRRILMPGTRTHLFYEVDNAEQVISIVFLWGARQDGEPQFDND